jgi:hypothetical protein
MRIENAVVSQSMIDLAKSIEKKELTNIGENGVAENENSETFIPLPFSSGGTYSVASLRSAVDYYAKFLTVADSNVQAAQTAQQTVKIPQTLLDHLNGKL